MWTLFRTIKYFFSSECSPFEEISPTEMVRCKQGIMAFNSFMVYSLLIFFINQPTAELAEIHSRMATLGRSKLPMRSNRNLQEEFFMDEDDFELAKRGFNEYGHLRFGRMDPEKLPEFDDYGHFRYGRR